MPNQAINTVKFYQSPPSQLNVHNRRVDRMMAANTTAAGAITTAAH